jgi:hypothetical protein
MANGATYATEFASGFKVVNVLVDAGTQTNTVSISGISTIRSIQATLAEAPTANAALLEVTHNGGSIATIREYTAQGTLNTQTALDFYLTVIGEY